MVDKNEDFKNENKKMGELMNAVLGKREYQEKHKPFRSKHIERLKKQKTETSNQDYDDYKIKNQGNQNDNRPMVQQIFKPMENSIKGETNIVALDCEMVEVDRWSEGLARVSIVNYYGNILMDKFVIPEGIEITNYRSWVSGVTPDKLKIENGAIHFKEAKKLAHKILSQKIIVGHSLKHDFDVLEFPESLRPKERVRDLVSYKKYQAGYDAINQLSNPNSQKIIARPSGAKGLKKLCSEFLGISIQEGAHSSVIDARASMALYRLVEQDWENQLKQKYSMVKKQLETDLIKMNSFFNGIQTQNDNKPQMSFGNLLVSKNLDNNQNTKELSKKKQKYLQKLKEDQKIKVKN